MNNNSVKKEEFMEIDNQNEPNNAATGLLPTGAKELALRTPLAVGVGLTGAVGGAGAGTALGFAVAGPAGAAVGFLAGFYSGLGAGCAAGWRAGGHLERD